MRVHFVASLVDRLERGARKFQRAARFKADVRAVFGQADDVAFFFDAVFFLLAFFFAGISYLLADSEQGAPGSRHAWQRGIDPSRKVETGYQTGLFNGF